MQRLSIGSPGTKAHLAGSAGDEADAKAAKTVVRPGPDKSIHLIPLLTLLCFLVLFLLSRDPSSLTDSPVLASAVTARSLEARVDTSTAVIGGGAVTRSSRRLKEDLRLILGRKLGMTLRRRRRR